MCPFWPRFRKDESKRAEAAQSQKIFSAEPADGGIVVLDESHIAWGIGVVCAEYDY